jgi:hypothetical protein
VGGCADDVSLGIEIEYAATEPALTRRGQMRVYVLRHLMVVVRLWRGQFDGAEIRLGDVLRVGQAAVGVRTRHAAAGDLAIIGFLRAAARLSRAAGERLLDEVR